MFTLSKKVGKRCAIVLVTLVMMVVSAGMLTSLPAHAASPATVPVYRVYNPHSGLHHYTKVAPERDQLAKLGWKLEGISFNAVSGGRPVYREYNPNNGNHNWTMNANEHRALIKLGWRSEGVAWYAPSSGSAVYRLYNPNSGEHVYTTSYSEYLSVGRSGWHKEGIAWYSYGSIRYANCKAVWAANGHGIRRGQPGYSLDLDADKDGYACETRP
ncbi:excalibur calcium-binding domain-containing protein [Bifidobacterium psychraerophilum]|uniref:Excalibur calcium-binding domain protein n=1 Tax=Bifidobacterium psychraerophilum TaxID=218140 RepID=A0A087CNK2_9BIFI|nr:excalibur calcium-binding domain-containing protein [Bifidobacterium psychraerophilum]KFI84852.1 Excalibur calcium-binding domain protein [Bifidobacterium psychraerophilum]PKA94016.1 excalibur calcium-binding domain-containing protein [Bifidobacterium psychraerophilum DSM 22366]